MKIINTKCGAENQKSCHSQFCRHIEGISEDIETQRIGSSKKPLFQAAMNDLTALSSYRPLDAPAEFSEPSEGETLRCVTTLGIL